MQARSIPICRDSPQDLLFWCLEDDALGNNTLHFKLTHVLRDQFVSNLSQLPVEVKLCQDKELQIRPSDESYGQFGERSLCCYLFTTKKISCRVTSILSALLKGRLLLDSNPQIILPYLECGKERVSEDGSVASDFIVPLDFLPKAARDRLSQVLAEMNSDITNFLNALRWRCASDGGYQVSLKSGLEWSTNQKDWHLVPYNYNVSAQVYSGLDFSKETLSNVTSLWKRGCKEPLAHELIREAKQLSQAAPRSALLMAFAALETGVKWWISDTVPETAKLLEKMPSPPVVTLIQEIVPSILEERSEQHDSFPLSKDAKEFLQKWNSQRNEVAHGRKTTLKLEELTCFIQFASDILYILDACSGHSWALDHLKTLSTEKPQG